MRLVSFLHQLMDFFYPLFKKFMDKKTYYYAVCGGSNTVLSWLLFELFFRIVFNKANTTFNFEFLGKVLNFTVTAYTYSAFLCLIISMTIGFLLNKFVVFTESSVKGHHQLMRYCLSAMISGFISWILLKIFIEGFNFYPFYANVTSTFFVVFVSYMLQRKFTFK
ncbi:MAG: GtrA family protein [Flavobacteriales bacterium]|nr:GtrA family protein [Crocinitomicaceae bacterium]NBX79076.1 GtrA family protein [Flavobacteriales bacterium]